MAMDFGDRPTGDDVMKATMSLAEARFFCGKVEGFNEALSIVVKKMGPNPTIDWAECAAEIFSAAANFVESTRAK